MITDKQIDAENANHSFPPDRIKAYHRLVDRAAIERQRLLKSTNWLK